MRKIRELQRLDSPPEPDRLGTYETISRAYHRMSEIGPPAPSISRSIAQEIPLSQLHTRFLYHRAMSNHNTINIYGETPLRIPGDLGHLIHAKPVVTERSDAGRWHCYLFVVSVVKLGLFFRIDSPLRLSL